MFVLCVGSPRNSTSVRESQVQTPSKRPATPRQATSSSHWLHESDNPTSLFKDIVAKASIVLTSMLFYLSISTDSKV